MAKVYWRILLSYFQNRRLWAPFALALFFELWFLGVEGWVNVTIMYVFPFALLVSVQIDHLKEQLANPRVRVIPRYRLTHFLVAALLAILVVSLSAFGMSGNKHSSFLGALAFLSVLFVGVAWLEFCTSFLLWLAVILAVGVFTGVYSEWYMSLLAGETPETAIIMIAISGVALLLLGICLPRAWVVQNPNAWITKVNDLGRWIDWVSVKVTGGSPRGPLNRPLGAGLWSRASLWRLGMGTMSPIIQAFLGIAIIFALSLPFAFGEPDPDSFFPPTPAGRINAAVFLWCGFVLPVITSISVARGWMTRLKRLGMESLRPAGRRRFIREMGLAFTIDLWTPWFIYMAAVGVSTALVRPDQFMTSSAFYVLLGSMCIPLMTYTTTVVLSAYKSEPLVMIALGVGIILLFMFALTFGQISSTYSSQGWHFGLFALTCVAAVFFAYRNWCNTELG